MKEKEFKSLTKNHLSVAFAELATKKDILKLDKKTNDLTALIEKTILELNN